MNVQSVSKHVPADSSAQGGVKNVTLLIQVMSSLTDCLEVRALIDIMKTTAAFGVAHFTMLIIIILT